MVVAYDHEEFRNVLNEADIHIIDGIGVLSAGSILNINVGDRLTGVDLMKMILEHCEKEPLRVLLLGSKPELADNIAKCYSEKYPNAQFVGLQGIENIQNPKNEEEMRIFSIVSDMRPHIIFASFGSPGQELWFWRHRAQLKGIVCIEVGGGFDFISGRVKRAPQFLRAIGLEWLFRLIIQPWRWRRQLRLFRFIYLVFKQKIAKVY